MEIHQDVSDVVKNVVLCDVFQVHGMEIPYLAELWINGECKHRRGVAMFKINDRGFLTIEYFGYDNLNWSPVGIFAIDNRQLGAKVIISNTQVEIPIWMVSSNPKTGTWHNVPMPGIIAYNCEIQGWLGDLNSKIKSVSMAITGMPDIHLGRMVTHVPEESTGAENLTLQGFKIQTGMLKFEAGIWTIELTKPYTLDAKNAQLIYNAKLSRKDGSAFILGDDGKRIINALRFFLAFQCGRWVDMPTIVCNPVYDVVEKTLSLRKGKTNDDILSAVRKLEEEEYVNFEAMGELSNSFKNTEGFEDVANSTISSVYISDDEASITFSQGDRTVRLARLGRLVSRDVPNSDRWTATDALTWPRLFSEFWNQYTNELDSKRMESTISYYVNCSQVFQDGSIHQSLVAAQATLEAIIRWWNDLKDDYYFGSGRGWNSVEDHLKKAVENAKLGKDQSKIIDEEELSKVINTAKKYRNKIDHGHIFNLDAEIQEIVWYQRYYHNLARFLLLAKFGQRDTDLRGYFGPSFKDDEL